MASKGYKQTPEHVAKRQASRQANHTPLPGDKYWRHRIKKRYGISADEYFEMLDEQDGRCAICGVHQDDLPVRLCVDHDHDTGRVRGLLCNWCNALVLPVAEKDPSLVAQALRYLEDQN